MKPNGYWTYERCRDEALKYSTKKEFSEKSGGATAAARRNGWMNDISQHMRPIGSKFFRCVYVYEFIEDNCAYIGLTYDIAKRHTDRNSRINDQVTKHIKETSYIPIRKQLTDYIDVKIAADLEGKYVEEYSANGWQILNVAKTGGIGGSTLYWNKEKCIEFAKTCKTRMDFYRNKGAYSSSRKNNWMTEIQNILPDSNYNVYYTKELCIEKANLCSTRCEFKRLYIHEFSAAYKNGWLDDICTHMVSGRIKWTKENCYKVSQCCTKRFEFRKKYKGAYGVSLKNNWLNEFFIKK